MLGRLFAPAPRPGLPMPLTCPRCRATVPAADVELSTRLAKCGACDEVFGFDVPPPRPGPVPLPERLRVIDDGTTRSISQSWFHPGLLFLVFFCIAWDSFLVFWYWMALVGPPGNAPPPGAPGNWLVIVFPVLHVAVGVALTYSTVAGLFNRTVVSVADGRLRVTHGPVPWSGNRDLDAADIGQLYCDEQSASYNWWGGRGNIWSAWGWPMSRFRLMAVLADGRALNLLGGIEQKTTALFYEQQLETWLDIPPRPVPGEVGR